MYRVAMMNLVVVAGLLIGCEEQTLTPPPPKTDEPAKKALEEIPESLRATEVAVDRKRIDLVVMPFTVRVPENWEVTPVASFASLTGRTPSGLIDIQLRSDTELYASDVVEAQIDELRREAAADDRKQVIERDIGQIRRVEFIDKSGELFKWRVQYYVPTNELLKRYELILLDMQPEQFEMDFGFLQEIIESIEYESTP